MEKRSIAALGIVLLALLAGCVQDSSPAPATDTSGSGGWTDFWTDRTVNFPVINATANYTGNETKTAGIYGTIKLFQVTNFNNASNATVIIKNEIGTTITSLTATASNTSTNRTVAYDNYGPVTLNVTCRTCAVRIVVKHT
jgi:hypothetical protein